MYFKINKRLKEKLASINEASELFAKEHGEQLQSILGNLEQTMFAEELYKSVEEKAANLLYMVIKDHPFSDGNTRIGSFLFLFYIQLKEVSLTKQTRTVTRPSKLDPYKDYIQDFISKERTCSLL